jgi:hypothetical protein
MQQSGCKCSNGLLKDKKVTVHHNSQPCGTAPNSVLSSAQSEKGLQMPEKYVSIVELLKNKKLLIDGKQRSKSGFLRLLRQTYKFNILMVRFPGENNGRAVAAITQADANRLIEAMTKPQVVSSDKDE